MAIQKVSVLDGCIGCGVCAQICPDVFDMTDIAVVKLGINASQFESTLREAVDNCPTSVIKVS